VATPALERWPRRSATNSSLALPIEACGHGDRIQQAQAHRALIGRVLELRARIRDAGSRARRQRDFDRKLADAPRRDAGHELLHVHSRAVQLVAALLGQDPHHREHARAETGRDQVSRRERSAATLVVDRRVRDQHGARGTVLRAAMEITLIFDVDIDHVFGS